MEGPRREGFRPRIPETFATQNGKIPPQALQNKKKENLKGIIKPKMGIKAHQPIAS